MAPMLLALACLLAIPGVWARDALALPCDDQDKPCAEKTMKHHAAGRIDTGKHSLSQPVS